MAATFYLAPAPVVRRVRGYFAPVNRGMATPVLFDPAEMGRFSLDSPPAPWVSLGWIRNFARKAASKTAPILTGIPAAVLEQTRETLDAQVSFQFLSWTKLTMALATGSQHMNLLVPAAGSAPQADGGVAAPAVVIQSGASATLLPLASADAAQFSAGQVVSVDVDYTGQTGFVGSPVSGAYVKTALTDVDYARRVTFNVATVASVSTSAPAGLTLAGALPGGIPATGMKVQALAGFVDREGGSFFQEWSALFVMEGAQGERIFFHYPRLQSMGSAAEAVSPLAGKQSGTLERVMLAGDFRALPVTDPLDGERVVCYRSYLPAS
ncbi:hypothetical protein [Acidicapsa acidisoli]|uniref:hypothetical protein n=1 Tax=Acidicapsa acidisoli TaxID=1615681 RepID=UPI0021DFCB6A|nr:hypothetical protein [Acidicapsa acidisoli]